MEKEYNYKIYTPLEIAKDMASSSLSHYFKGEPSMEKLMDLKILDLSCGSGNLLLCALEELILLGYSLTGKYFYNPGWIRGYDIDGNALKIFEAKATELLKKYDLKGAVSLHMADSLLLPLDEKYDILLGNPPYLGEKNNKEIFRSIKMTEFGKKYYEAKMDYLYFFIEKGVELLKPEGFLTYLTTNYWLKADSALKLRTCLREGGSFLEIRYFDISLFTKATGQHNLIFTWQKGKISDTLIQNEDEKFHMDTCDLYGEKNKILLIPKEFLETDRIIKERCNLKLGDLLKVNQGIVTGMDKAFIFPEFKEEFEEYLRPFYKNKDIGKYTVSSTNPFWILYLTKNSEISSELLNHLNGFKENLSKRREAVAGKIKWWELQWGREEEIFTSPKIVVRQRCKSNNFAYCEKEFFGSADIYYLTPKEKNINLFYILGYLNSHIFYEWFKYNGKIKGKNLEFYSTPLKETPLYYPEDVGEITYIEDLVKSQILNYSEEIQDKLNIYFTNLFKGGAYASQT